MSDVEISDLKRRLEDLKAKQAVSEMIMVTIVLPIVMAGVGEELALDLVKSMRTSFEISSDPIDASERKRLSLIVKQELDGIADRVERCIRGVAPDRPSFSN